MSSNFPEQKSLTVHLWQPKINLTKMLLQNYVLHPNTSSINNRTESYELGESRSKATLDGMGTAKNLNATLLHLILPPPPCTDLNLEKVGQCYKDLRV